MPVRGRGAFPKPAPIYREGNDTRGSQRTGGQQAIIAEYRALKKLERSNEALQLLRRIGAIVRPIMQKHGWRLPLLVEMYPKNDALLGLNVNRGQKIALRLRRPFNDAEFIDEQSLVETMLHELTHNIRGPHDEVFYKHLELLTQEWYDLRRNERLAGQGFWSPGQTLGSSSNGVLDPVHARAAAMNMGRKDEQISARSGTYQLGGPSSVESILTPQELAAIAAERRRQIAAGCPSGDADRNRTAADEQDEQEEQQGTQVITIESDDEDEDDFEIIKESRRQASHSHQSAVPSLRTNDDSDEDIIFVDVKLAGTSQDASSVPEHDNLHTSVNTAAVGGRHRRTTRQLSESADGLRLWTCQSCTLRNTHNVLVCAACDAVRPGVANWTCRKCHHRMLGAFAEFWCCSACGTVKIA